MKKENTTKLISHILNEDIFDLGQKVNVYQYINGVKTLIKENCYVYDIHIHFNNIGIYQSYDVSFDTMPLYYDISEEDYWDIEGLHKFIEKI